MTPAEREKKLDAAEKALRLKLARRDYRAIRFWLELQAKRVPRDR
jgi:hypothetical protein